MKRVAGYAVTAAATLAAQALWRRRQDRLKLMPIGITKAAKITMRQSLRQAKLKNIASVASGTIMDQGHMGQVPFVRAGVDASPRAAADRPARSHA